jgi:hypothetical protein
MKIFVSFLLLLLVFSITVFAHEEEQEVRVDEELRENSVLALIIAAIIVALFVLYALHAEKEPHYTETKKMVLFFGIVIPIVLATIYLIGATIYLNAISQTGGPVHWHADYEIWACGNKIEMKEPEGFSNKVGTEVLHHHGDHRIHVEGVLVDVAHADLHEFFEVTGGELEQDSITVPTSEYVASFKNGDTCNGYAGELQVFLYKTVDGTVVQEKLDDFEDYVLSPYPNVPPGDCIIFEFDQPKERTKHMCETYKIAINKGAVSYGG